MSARWKGAERLDPAWRDGLLGPGTMFELVDEDVLGATVPVFAQRPRSMTDVLARAAERYPDRPFLIGPDRTVTFADAPLEAEQVASVLADRHGVAPGDRIGLAGRFSIEHAITVWGATRSGAVAATMNPAWTAAELAAATALVGPKLVVVDDDVTDRLDPIRDRGVAVTTFAELVAAADEASDRTAPPVEVHEDDPFTIIFTSGTTGTPKGATLSHRNAIQFSLAAAATSAVHSIAHEIPRGDGIPTTIAASPLFHVSGLLGQLTNSAHWGTTLVIAPAGRWDETTHLQLTERHRVTSWSLVPTQLWRLLDHPDLGQFDLSSLEMVGGGGATFSPELLRRTSEQLPGIALALRVGYGMTETAGTATLLQPPVDPDRLASVGTPVAGAEVKIIGADGDDAPDGVVGEIAIRGAQVFLGYWGNDAATAAVLDADRWYRTGDYGRLDDGYLTLESRLRDLIIRGGENIYPIEVENRLVEHPDVVDAAVVGIDHPTLGQEVRAVIVTRDGTSIDDDALRRFVGETLARHKVPAHIDVVAELPRNATGKVQKDQLVSPPT